jgi:hypothetical protein
LESSDYDIINLYIPYGPGWDARRIEKLVYKTVRTSLRSPGFADCFFAGFWCQL